jgi:hypothetical protein
MESSGLSTDKSLWIVLFLDSTTSVERVQEFGDVVMID